METTQKATLGCGTLILIGLIVMIFGNVSGRQAAKEVSELRNEVKTLQAAVSAQTKVLDTLNQRLSSVLERCGSDTMRK